MNIHYMMFKRPDQAQWPEDFTIHIDAVTGEKRSFREFVARVYDLTTALGGAPSDGCLGMNTEDKVGVLMENSSVCLSNRPPCADFQLVSSSQGICHASPCMPSEYDTICPHTLLLHRFRVQTRFDAIPTISSRRRCPLLAHGHPSRPRSRIRSQQDIHWERQRLRPEEHPGHGGQCALQEHPFHWHQARKERYSCLPCILERY